MSSCFSIFIPERDENLQIVQKCTRWGTNIIDIFGLYLRFSLDFTFLCDILCADKAERSHTMTTEEKIKGLEHLLRKCPDVITALEASRLIHVSKNSIHAAINEGKLIAYAYRGKRLISKADFIDYLAATTDDETAWQRRQRERG